MVDSDGAPKPNSSYLLIPIGADGCFGYGESWVERVSDRDGVVDEKALPPGVWRVMFAPTYCEPQTIRVELLPGPNDLGVLVFPVVVEAGEVRVRIEDVEPDARPTFHVSLRSIGDLSVDRWNQIGGTRRFGSGPSEDGALEFAFEHLPAGEYEVQLHPDADERVDRLTARALVPGPPLVFHSNGREVGLPLEADWRDGATGKRLEAGWLNGYDAIAQAWRHDRFGPDRPRATVPRRSGIRWFASARSYETQELAPEQFRWFEDHCELSLDFTTGSRRLVISRDADFVTRTPGIGWESEIRSAHAPQLGDVVILADGAVVGRTDRDGVAVLSRPSAPPLRWSTALPSRCIVAIENEMPSDNDTRPATFWLSTRE